MSWAYCAMAAAHVWLGRTCAVANCQQQQHQHGAHAGCAIGSNMILYLAFILDDTVGEWHQVRDLFLCIKTLYVMILDFRFICVKLVWFETSNETTCNDRREGPGGESLPVNTWKHRAPQGDANRLVNRIRFEFGGTVNRLRKSVLVTALLLVIH